ncbi:hypothetical protein ACFV7Q_16150 [Streptomyces sp. NPDC059851]|uniref:hypothetical protein n=1 Tax=Streptomyces sp. NPDC059851 TaxID=3346971 RepID=UPI0036548158
MSRFALDEETDPVRRDILAAMNRLFAGTPARSAGRLNVSQLAAEAGLKRWHLTHQHPDLKDLFQSHVAQDHAARPKLAETADAHTDLKRRHADLQAHCQNLEKRLAAYANALHLLALENAALADRHEQQAKIRPLPRPR